MPRMLNKLLLATAALLVACAANASCQIAYGASWAIGFETPKGWKSACGVDAQLGAPIALWPSGSTFADAAAVMYINVSIKDPPTLPAFAEYSQRQFRAQAPNVSFSPLKTGAHIRNAKILSFSAKGDPGGNSESISYIEGPSAFFIAVVSARTPQALENARPAYIDLLKSLIPMTAKVQK